MENISLIYEMNLKIKLRVYVLVLYFFYIAGLRTVRVGIEEWLTLTCSLLSLDASILRILLQSFSPTWTLKRC